MFFKVIDPDGIYQETFVNINNIEAITAIDGSMGRIKIHSSCGKEFRAAIECLTILLPMLDTWKIIDSQFRGRGAFLVPNHIQAITTIVNFPGKIKVHMTSLKEFRCDKHYLSEIKEKINVKLI